MSTIKDVAALAGVAPSTVSNVFTKKKYVSPKVTRKVREACEQLNYTPSFLASGMRTQKTSLIGLMLSSAAGGFQEFYHYFIEGATIAAAECGYSVILYYEVTDKEKLRAIFASGRGPIEGAVLLTPPHGRLPLHRNGDKQYPVRARRQGISGRRRDVCGRLQRYDHL